jgi:hypothetical protein
MEYLQVFAVVEPSLFFFNCRRQCCGSGTGSGFVRIRNFWPDPIRNRNKHFGCGFESGSETGSKKKKKRSLKCRQSARLFLQSSELRLPHLLTRRQVCSPLLWFRGGYTLTEGEGWGGPNSDEGTDTVVLYRYLPIHAPAWGMDTIYRQYAYGICVRSS